MKNIKKLICLSLCTIMAVSFAACKKNDNDNNDKTTNSSITTQSAEENSVENSINENNNTTLSSTQTTDKSNQETATTLQPINVKVNLPALPSTVNNKSSSNSAIITSKLKFTRVSYTAFESNGQVLLKFKYTAKKTYDDLNDNNKSSVIFKINLINDKTGEVVYTTNLSTNPIAVGDVCSDYGFEILCAKTESYTLQIL